MQSHSRTQSRSDIPPSLSSSSSSWTSSLYRASTTSSAPSYTSLPSSTEETIEANPRLGSSLFTAAGARGTFTKKWKSMTLTLARQPGDDVQNPIYDRSGRVIGELEMKCPKRVLNVSVQLEGRVTTSAAGAGAKLLRIIREPAVVLWEKGDGEGEQGTKRCCPGILFISLRFPATFVDDDGKQWKLPPSFEPDFVDVSTMFVRCTYTLSISLTRMVNYRLLSRIKRKTYDVLLDHIPRDRPNQPIPRFDSLFGSVKSVPDEWVQLVSKMEVTPESRLQPVKCHFFVPSNPTFCVSEAIPFHIQISGSLGTLRELFPLSSCLLKPGGAQGRGRKAMQGQFSMQIYIARSITVKIRGKTGSRNFSIGSGTLRPVPPTDLGGMESGIVGDVCLDWEGEVKCWTEIKCGGFDIGCLSVKDYIVFASMPPLRKKAGIVGLEMAHAVRFVTDPWLEYADNEYIEM